MQCHSDETTAHLLSKVIGIHVKYLYSRVWLLVVISHDLYPSPESTSKRLAINRLKGLSIPVHPMSTYIHSIPIYINVEVVSRGLLSSGNMCRAL
jgi:hypothetical protein